MNNPQSKLAEASFFCGLASLIFSILAGIPAIILGHKARAEAKRLAQPQIWKSLVGIIMGYLSLLVLLLLTPGLAVGKKAIAHAQLSVAKNTCANLVLAIDAFYDEYHKLPLASFPQPLRTDGSGIIDVLTGHNPAENPRNFRFFMAHHARGSSASKAKGGLFHFSPTHAKLVDPWGRPYFLLLDVDYDGQLADPHSGKIIHGQRTLVWSAGKDGKTHPTASHPDNKRPSATRSKLPGSHLQSPTSSSLTRRLQQGSHS